MSLTSKIRDHLTTIQDDTFTCAEIGRVLGITNLERLRTFIYFLIQRGEVKRSGWGIYQVVKLKHPKSNQPRIFRAMHVKGIFSAREIASLADLERSYIHKVIRKLIQEGELEKTGKQKGISGASEWVYRVRHRDKFYLNHIVTARSGIQNKSKKEGVIK